MMYSEPGDFTAQDLRVLKFLCSEHTLMAGRVFFKVRDGSRLIIVDYHKLVAQTLDRVASGEITRLIINVPPGYTKTELAVIFFVLKCYIKNKQCRFIHASYSASLATRNSAVIRNMTQTPLFQAMCKMEKREDLWQKHWWANTVGGEFLAASSDGQITGFRAGHMDKNIFTGAIIIDDPVKPGDALSKVTREQINFNFNNTFRSRLAHDDVPIIVIMQRVHEEDLSGYLLRGGSDEKWYHLIIPARIPDIKEEYPKKYTHGIPIPYDLPPGPLWTFKHSDTELLTIEKGNSFVWAGQYMQDPSDPGSQIFPRSWWPRWDFAAGVDKFNSYLKHSGERIGIQGLHIFADTAMKTGVTNDYSVFQCWAVGDNGKIYMVDQVRGKWEAPELERKAVEFMSRWQFVPHKCNLSVQTINIEDKSSGTGLIQTLHQAISRGDLAMPPITPIPRHIDKVARALTAAPAVERGDVVIPDSAPWIEEYLSEFEQFTANMTHKHDDQIDPTLDAVYNLLISGAIVDYTQIV